MNCFKASKFFLFISVLFVGIVTSSTLFPFIVGKYVWFRTSIGLALILFCLGLLYQDKGFLMVNRIIEVFKKPIVIVISVFVAVFLLACLFGFDPINSFWSNFERGEGGLQILNFYVFFLLLITLFKEEKDWKLILSITIFGGLLMVFYGLLAGSGVQGFAGIRFGESGFRFQGSIGNAAYVAAYSIFMMFYVAYLFFSSYGLKKIKSFGAISLIVLGLVFLTVFFSAATRGAFLGLIGALLVFIFYFGLSKKKYRKWFFTAGLICIILVGSLIYFQNSNFVKSIPGSRIFNISFTAKTFQDRTIMWDTAINGWKARPILGWGPENFIQVFNRHFNTEYFDPSQGFGAWFDRAHSVYFDYLVETGILGLLSFLSIFAIFYWQFFKKIRTINNEKLTNKDNNFLKSSQSDESSSLAIKGLFLAVPIAYLIQGIVLFDVSVIYFNIFLFMAFSVYKFYFDKSFNQ